MRSWRSNYRGTARERARTHVCRIHPRHDRGNLSHGPRNISFLERANDVSSPEPRPVSGSIMSSSVIRAGATRLKRLYPAIKKFPNIIFFCVASSISVRVALAKYYGEPRINALFVVKLSRDGRNCDCYRVEPQRNISKVLTLTLIDSLANL